MQKQPITLPRIYNYYEAKKAANEAFNNSVDAFRNMLYLLFVAEGIELPHELNDPKKWPNMEWLTNHNKRFYLTTGQTEGYTRFVCIVSAMGNISYAVEVCEKRAPNQLNVTWETIQGISASVISDEDYLTIGKFETVFPLIIKAMKSKSPVMA